MIEEDKGKYLHAYFTEDDTYYRLDNGYVETNTSEENIKKIEEQLKKKLPRKSIRIPPPWKEKEERDCKCFLSIDMKTVPNGNKVGDIGVNIVERINRHVNGMCPVHSS
jgi:hypothetical protein